MMPQMDAGEPMAGRADAPDGRYEGDQRYSQQQYEAPYNQSQQGPAGMMGKLHISSGSSKASPGQRLALALISVIGLIPISIVSIVMTTMSHTPFGLIGLGISTCAIVLINAVFNESFKS